MGYQEDGSIRPEQAATDAYRAVEHLDIAKNGGGEITFVDDNGMYTTMVDGLPVGDYPTLDADQLVGEALLTGRGHGKNKSGRRDGIATDMFGRQVPQRLISAEERERMNRWRRR